MDDADRQRIGLGVRQPWAELILQGLKTVEVRSSDTQVRGTIYLYAAKKLSELPAAVETATRHGLDVETLPRGLVVGTVELVGSARSRPEDAEAACVPPAVLENRYSWRLQNPLCLPEPMAPRFLPYGVWFYPFCRRSSR